MKKALINTNSLLLNCLRPTNKKYCVVTAVMALVIFSGLANVIISKEKLAAIALFILSDTIAMIILIVIKKIHRLTLADLVSSSCLQLTVGLIISTESTTLLLKCVAAVCAATFVIMLRKNKRHRKLLRIRTLSGFLMILGTCF